MKFDLVAAMAAAEQRVEPWEFIITASGGDWPTRPLTVADIGVLARFDSMTAQERDDAVGGLFAGEAKPTLASWDPQLVEAAVISIVSYFRGRAQKKSAALAAMVESTALAAK